MLTSGCAISLMNLFVSLSLSLSLRDARQAEDRVIDGRGACCAGAHAAHHAAAGHRGHG
jgi:hypothetical protein